MLCVLFLYSLSCYCVTLYYLAIDWQCIAYCLLGVVFACLLVVCYYFNLCYILAICVRGVGLSVLVTLSICLQCCLIRSCWLVSILPCNYIINTYIPLYIASIRVYLSLWCIAGIIYDNAPLKDAYLLGLVLVGWYLYFIFPCLHIHKKRK